MCIRDSSSGLAIGRDRNCDSSMPPPVTAGSSSASARAATASAHRRRRRELIGFRSSWTASAHRPSSRDVPELLELTASAHRPRRFLDDRELIGFGHRSESIDASAVQSLRLELTASMSSTGRPSRSEATARHRPGLQVLELTASAHRRRRHHGSSGLAIGPLSSCRSS